MYLLQDGIQDQVLQYLKSLAGGIQFLCYGSSGILDLLVASHKLPAKNLTISAQEKLYYDDKINFHGILKLLGIETLPTIVSEIGNLYYSDLKDSLGGNIVIKLPYGSGGSGVFYVENQEYLDQVQQQFCSMTALLQRFQAGISLNVQAAIFSDNIVVAPPSVQIIGAQECSQKNFDWCGNDFHVKEYAPDYLVNEAVNITKKIGHAIKRQGYKGIFGIDFLLDIAHDKIYALEINPRQQGSTSLLTQLELINKAPSHLMEYHFLAFEGEIPIRPRHSLPASFSTSASQIILYNKLNQKKQIKHSLKPGVYILDERDNTLRWIRRGFTLLDCREPGEFVIAGGIPLYDEIIMPDAPILWVQSFEKVLTDPTSGKLTQKMSIICNSIYKSLGF